jgi:hypothetical protein
VLSVELEPKANALDIRVNDKPYDFTQGIEREW